MQCAQTKQSASRCALRAAQPVRLHSVRPSRAGFKVAAIKVGDRLPDAKFQILDEGASEPRDVSLSDLTSGKKAVLFGLPGAYTSVCSSKHVPQYNERYDALKKKGVDVIACLSVNDPFVMREWAKSLGVDVKKICMLADGEALFHKKVELVQQMPGLGERAIRYSMFVDDGVVRVLNIEEVGGKSYKVSGPDHMLADLEAVTSKA